MYKNLHERETKTTRNLRQQMAWNENVCLGPVTFATTIEMGAAINSEVNLQSTTWIFLRNWSNYKKIKYTTQI